MISKTCLQCSIDFQVDKWRSGAKFCSRTCSDLSKVSGANVSCSHCGSGFHIKPSQLARYQRRIGVFCSVSCSAKAKSKAYSGESNPNYKGKNTDSNGYRIYAPQSSNLNFRGMKLHQAVCCEILGLERIPAGFHVHHRDCDIQNNDPKNLAVLSVSDHKWLHKQFGIATLWAYYHEKAILTDLVSWSDDHARASRLLVTHVSEQVGSVCV